MKKNCKKPINCGKIEITQEVDFYGKKNIIEMLLEKYDIKFAENIEDALKNLLGGTMQEMICTQIYKFLLKYRSPLSRSITTIFPVTPDFTSFLTAANAPPEDDPAKIPSFLPILSNLRKHHHPLFL